MIEDFKLELSRVDSDLTVYVGTVKGAKAICVVPHKVVNQEEFVRLINGNKAIIQQNDIYTTYSIKGSTCFDVRVFCPAEEKHVKKYLGQNKFTTETYEEYLTKRKEMANVVWIDNIINGTSMEKIYYDDSEFVLIANYKWNGLSNEALQLLLIFKDENLKTLRDLENEDILKRAKGVIIRELEQFGMSYSDVIVFFHYPPTYNQLHLHIENINIGFSTASFVGRAKLLDDVIYSLSVDQHFYKKDLSFAIKND